MSTKLGKYNLLVKIFKVQSLNYLNQETVLPWVQSLQPVCLFSGSVSTTCCISSNCSSSHEPLIDHFFSRESLMVHYRKCITLKMLHLRRHLRHFSYKSHEVPWKSSISFPVLSVMVPLRTLILPSRCLQSWDFLSHSIDLTKLFFKLP